MYLRLLWMVLAFAMATQAAAVEPSPPELRPSAQQPKAAHLASQVLNRYHYRTLPLDDALSERIFEAYLKTLDPEKLFFIQGDIDQWASARTRLDDAILNEDLTLPFSMFNLYVRRASERFAYARSLLKAGFDFRQDESYRYLREKQPWARSNEEVQDLWRKRVKNDWLSLRLAGRKDKQIAQTLDKRYANSLKRISKLKSEDAFQVFMNAYTMSLDPHTNYLGPEESEEFDISMRLSLVGIGAVLEEKDEYATIKELVPGGPAALSERLKAGDRIIGVAQGEKGAMADVVGWRLSDTVALIRGAVDSTVLLDVLPAEAGPSGKHKRVKLVRKKINLEAQAARKSILSLPNGKVKHRVGVITLPTFYEDFDARQKGDPNYRSATRDVARLIGELKKEKVEAILIDLRNNGGGSLTEAVELTGLFIDKGPVVQQRDAQGHISVERDPRAGMDWDGPMGVLINRGSASASEIFAAAIQDYRRGLVIGEPSFGKGTVQSIIDLDQIARQEKFGEVKVTIAQFFRVNGSTTQLRGVSPDIDFPPLSDNEHFGESSYDNALPFTRIKPADYVAAEGFAGILPILKKRHDDRVARDKDFRYLLEDMAELKLQREKNLISLNEVERRKERDALEARLKARGKPGKRKSDDWLEEGEAEDTKKNSPLLKEAALILADEVEVLQGLPARASPGLARRP